MSKRLSSRLQEVVDALPLRTGMRVLEIGGAPGAAAREVAQRVGTHGHVLVLDRSATGIADTARNCANEIEAGVLSTLHARVEDFVLPAEMAPFDLAFACRVGALDSRHAHLLAPALDCIAGALTPTGRLFIDGGNPVQEISFRD